MFTDASLCQGRGLRPFGGFTLETSYRRRGYHRVRWGSHYKRGTSEGSRTGKVKVDRKDRAGALFEFLLWDYYYRVDGPDLVGPVFPNRLDQIRNEERRAVRDTLLSNQWI